MFKITGLALILFFQSVAFSAFSEFTSASELSKLQQMQGHTKRLLVDIERMLPAGGEVSFLKDITFEVEDADKNNFYSYYKLGTVGFVKNYPGAYSKAIMCGMALSKKITERSYLREGSVLKIKSVEYLVTKARFTGETSLEKIKINFDHQNISSLNCYVYASNVFSKEHITSASEVLIGLGSILKSPTMVEYKGLGL